MHRIRKNYPVIAAWLAYVFTAWLLKKLLESGAVWVLKRFSFELSSNSYVPILILGIGVLIVAEYAGFASSVRWVALPLSRMANIFSTKPQSGFLILDWLSFCYYFVLFCLPLLVINEFPVFTLDVEGLPISTDAANSIGLVWKYAVSLFVYRDIVLSSLNDMVTEHSSTGEYQATV